MYADNKKTIFFSVNSQINNSSTNKVTNPINIEIPNGFWKEVIIEEGFVVVRIPQSYQLSQLPTSFQLLSSVGTSDYLGDNLSATDNVGVFFIDSTTDIPLAGANDIYSFGFKLMNPVFLKNVASNIQLSVVGRVLNATFPTTDELFENRQYKSGLYYLNFNWSANLCYSAVYFKINLIK